MDEAGPFSTAVAALCDEIADRFGPVAGAGIRAVRRRLGPPLRVTVAGGRSAGRSTLVNALVGRRVAPTGDDGRTRVVTQYRYGDPEETELVLHDGTRTAAAPDDDVSYVDVRVASGSLRTMTVVDTPGSFLFDDEDPGLFDPKAPDEGEVAARRALYSAEAIVYVYGGPVRHDAAQALSMRDSRFSGHPVNSIAVLTRVDALVGTGADPWPVADQVAADQAKLLRRSVSAVIPVVGLLAEATATGGLAHTEVDALRRLARLPVGERRVLLASAPLFRNRACEVPREVRERLVGRLGMYGVAFAVSVLGTRRTSATTTWCGWCSRRRACPDWPRSSTTCSTGTATPSRPGTASPRSSGSPAPSSAARTGTRSSAAWIGPARAPHSASCGCWSWRDGTAASFPPTSATRSGTRSPPTRPTPPAPTPRWNRSSGGSGTTSRCCSPLPSAPCWRSPRRC
ncbi:dynamin family protein [Virgisporangium ochraceum]|uniref:Dynamin N-terminal domain-containing protein n=1 Tax=Virgisporangium ochraceum TaxID=65505 RepID=A0A8J4A0P6_9ACTN|nr:dynamin family protein [Virgisporangium ochraceum]GIJ73607.1 hypothetical protein Voc01_085240 [Virgisporangium ochraceum]